MDSYTPTYNFYASSPPMSNMYPNYHTPPSSYCSCCYSSPTPYYHQQISPSYIYPSPTSPFIPQNTQISIPTVPTQSIQTPPSSSKTNRLQYSNKDRYILNELFKRTPYPNAIQRDVIARQLGITQEQIRIWFQNRRRLQTQRDTGERLATATELLALQQGKISVSASELKNLLVAVTQYKDAPPRLRLNESS